MVTDALDYEFLLLENYKKMKISETELSTIIMIKHLTDLGNAFVTADLLSLKMSLEPKAIDKVLATLLERGFLEYTTKGRKTITSLEPLKKKLLREYTINSANESARENSKEAEEELKNVYETFETLLSRTLAPTEISKIGEWLSEGYTEDDIINSLKDALSRGKKSLREVDKVLLARAQREEIEAEGHTARSSDWNKSLEETIRIAKTPWLKNDDK